MADNVQQQFGNYNPDIMPIYTTTPLNGLKRIADATTFEPGCLDNRCIHYNSLKVKTAVENAEAIFICLGTGIAFKTTVNIVSVSSTYFMLSTKFRLFFLITTD